MGNSTKMSARERINSLLDEKSFVEIGALVTKRNTDFNLAGEDAASDGVVTGYGLIDGSLVYVYSQDASVLSGTIGEMHAKKIVRLYDIALKTGAPIIGIVDCAGLRLQESTDALAGFGEIFLKQTMASGVVPTISVVLGTCGGGCAVLSSLSDFTFISKDAKLFVNSPNTLDGNNVGKCDTSDAKYQAVNGVADVLCEDDADALAKVRELVAVLPSNNQTTAEDVCNDDLNRNVSYDAYADDPALALRDISDDNFFFEVKAECAKEMVVGFIKLDGLTVGAIANRRSLIGDDGKEIAKFENVLTTKGCEKAERFVKFCDAFGIPVVTFTNTVGFKASKEEEVSIALSAAKLTAAFAGATVAKINVINKNAFGSAYVVMNSKHIGADMVFAVEDSKVGIMNADLAAQIIAPNASSDERAKVADEFDNLQNNVLSATKRGYVDSIIPASSIRAQLAYTFGMLYSKKETVPTKKHSSI